MKENEVRLKAYNVMPKNSSDFERFCEGWEAGKKWATAITRREAAVPVIEYLVSVFGVDVQTGPPIEFLIASHREMIERAAEKG